MRYPGIISLILLPHLAPALGAVPTVSGHDAVSMKRRDILSDIKEQKAKLLKAAGEGVKAVGEGIKHIEGEVLGKLAPVVDYDTYYETFDEAGDTIAICAAADCKKTRFMNEAIRWVKQAVKDVGVVIQDNPVATTALVIGVVILTVELISGGIIVPAVLEAVGFTATGPLKNSFAAAVQRVIGPVKLGSTFAQLQSAAMGGAAKKELTQLAHTLIAGLIGAGAGGLISSGVKPPSHSARSGYTDWGTWELGSKVDDPANLTGHASHLWGTPTYAGCVSYGYQDVRASLSFIPEGMDPLTMCEQAPALINGFGFKTPFRCEADPKKGVVGIWYVPTNTTRCMPRWSVFEDEGCMFYGRRRKFARLMGLNNNDDWKSVCASTPAIIDDKHYDRPSQCDDKGVLGIYGVFNIKDKQCECACGNL